MSTSAGGIVLDVDYAAIRAASDLKPVCRVYTTAAQAMADNTITTVLFGGEDIDTHGFHSTSVNTNRITPTVAGIYRLTFSFFMAGNTTYATIRGTIRKNATVQAPSTQWGNLVNAVNSAWMCTALLAADGVSDYFDCAVTQDNTTNIALNLQSAHPNVGVFECEYIRGPG